MEVQGYIYQTVSNYQDLNIYSSFAEMVHYNNCPAPNTFKSLSNTCFTK